MSTRYRGPFPSTEKSYVDGLPQNEGLPWSHIQLSGKITDYADRDSSATNLSRAEQLEKERARNPHSERGNDDTGRY